MGMIVFFVLVAAFVLLFGYWMVRPRKAKRRKLKVLPSSTPSSWEQMRGRLDRSTREEIFERETRRHVPPSKADKGSGGNAPKYVEPEYTAPMPLPDITTTQYFDTPSYDFGSSSSYDSGGSSFDGGCSDGGGAGSDF